jgi:hypothetical protein
MLLIWRLFDVAHLPASVRQAMRIESPLSGKCCKRGKILCLFSDWTMLSRSDNQVTLLSAYGAKIRHTPIWRYAQSKNLKLYDSVQRGDGFHRKLVLRRFVERKIENV